MNANQKQVIIKALQAEARRLYLSLMHKNHPDKFPPEQRELQTRITQEINRMYERATKQEKTK